MPSLLPPPKDDSDRPTDRIQSSDGAAEGKQRISGIVVIVTRDHSCLHPPVSGGRAGQLRADRCCAMTSGQQT
ncbi:unnamed protein product [Soboliphyme baturini]|uniref:Uncharacterized protein n=1 Tax=Soboliphyme baturini TaxID=241478 RepID=A0A183IJ49_9BILA|nr:unnamed protein product [Soboliphyme baturini]